MLNAKAKARTAMSTPSVSIGTVAVVGLSPARAAKPGRDLITPPGAKLAANTAGGIATRDTAAPLIPASFTPVLANHLNVCTACDAGFQPAVMTRLELELIIPGNRRKPHEHETGRCAGSAFLT
jgi:hypothetical protein